MFDGKTPTFDERQHLGEISYDLVMDEDMTFSEGTFRIGSGDWQVLIISKRAVESLFWKYSEWENGASGVVVHVPDSMRLNMESIEELLFEIVGVKTWKRVRGPDSMQLR